ncbi:MAG: type II toxin-antitoxin system death-on-curing family toxin [Clostridia bacterium]|nr:type II toxin-antitoxin system death-on-curing family toxin [Clostridia bacterium]
MDIKKLILCVHSLVVGHTKSPKGILNQNALGSISTGVNQFFGDTELYPSIESKAAFLAFAIIQDHVFEEGNKRTGIGVLLTYLKQNGISLVFSQAELVDLGLGIATSKYKQPEILNWINNHKS